MSVLRSHPQTRTVPVILLSARAGEEARIEGLQSGADDYLVKPFTARELLARVDTHLRMSHAVSLLTAGGKIADVAHQSGYDNPFAFSTAFKRVMKKSPSKFRA